MTSVREARPEAACVVWDWRSRIEAPAPAPLAATRAKGFAQAFGVAGVGVLIHMFWSTAIATVVFGIASIIFLAAALSPTGVYLGIQRLIAALGGITGVILTWALLTPLFYLFFLPFGRLMRRGRRDRMRRILEPDADSYWEPHSGSTASSGSHERHF